MRIPLSCLLLALALGHSGTAAASEARIGVVAPLSEAMAILGEQLVDGARLAAAASETEIVVADDGCTPEGGASAAREMIAQRVGIVVGFLCTEAIEAALPLLAAARIPVVTPGVRTDSLTDTHERTGWLVFRIAPRADAEHAALAEILPRLWRNELFAIVDDGTIYGRELAETFRFAAGEAGLEAVFFDTFRPQLDNQIGLVGRLRRAGATHVFVGGDREDVAIIARDAAELDYELTVLGGEALRAAEGEVALPEGVLMIGLPEAAETAGADALAAIEAARLVPEGYVLPGHAAMEIAVAAVENAGRDGGSVVQALRNGTFDTVLGKRSFDARGDLAENPYRLFRYDGTAFQPIEQDE